MSGFQWGSNARLEHLVSQSLRTVHFSKWAFKNAYLFRELLTLRVDFESFLKLLSSPL